MRSMGWLGEITSTLICRSGSPASRSFSGAMRLMVRLILCTSSISTLRLSRKILFRAWPAICATEGYKLPRTRFGVGPSLVEGDTLPGGVPGAGDGDRVQTAVVDVLLDATEVQAAGQHIGERTVVEKRNRAGARQQRDRGEPAQPHAGDPDR